ncbi:2-oxo-4-hydroxy-4-carboxy-5-ureidoimidazoline decarboxylase [Acinetobacter boissieri]|uniref:2-oxo-4-hydroxy-4-carboxy-5-ureidoimidazoline decarboxylase n=1 Tax=Acinetobacter boissieri TaxID=1219383 RepID=A0A1G6GJD4_9GAMM|nr:2-oxo-4-hydroxy-4-carboxy-5-ureidoimidazoline decarboxylase [Acinetobacter boissieri]SDB82132.1 2-oxo-4-hydroxy-4-carboxy-5-ureidoimidazoline decarboxylase [Acinetobacter boissieri]
MQLVDFNQARSTEVAQFLQSCVNIESWVDHIQQKRPFPSKQSLICCAENQAKTWQWVEIESALSKHPRIGEKPSTTHLSAQEQQHSHAEQANISQDQRTQMALLAGNIAYEEKFGFIFLIKAAGLSSEQVLEQLTIRLTHDTKTEQHIVKQQLALIALRRLDQRINP